MSHPRRDTLLTILAAMAATALPAAGHAAEDDKGLAFGPAEPFSFRTLKAMAAENAGKPWASARSPYGAILDKIDYDNFQSIVFNKDYALWNDGKGRAPVQLFHLGK